MKNGRPFPLVNVNRVINALCTLRLYIFIHFQLFVRILDHNQPKKGNVTCLHNATIIRERFSDIFGLIDLEYLHIRQRVNMCLQSNTYVVFNLFNHNTFVLSSFCQVLKFSYWNEFHSRHFFTLNPFFKLRPCVHGLSQPYIILTLALSSKQFFFLRLSFPVIFT